MLKAYKYRLYPSAEQKVQIHQHFGCARWIYNYALNKKVIAFQTEKKSLSRFDIQADLPNLKRIEATAWLKEVNSQTLQASLENLDKALALFGANPTFPNTPTASKTQQPDVLMANYGARRTPAAGGLYTEVRDAFIKAQAAKHNL